jgi:hypothetical protein
MKIIIANRSAIYKMVSLAFKHLGIRPIAAELGVLDGINAEEIYKTIRPEEMCLIDSWSKEVFEDYRKNNAHRPWVNDIEEYAHYFGGSLNDQKTFDNLYLKAVKRFKGKDNIKIFRSASIAAIPSLLDFLNGKKFNYIYVDASHQYETVFDDLMEYQHLLDENAFFQLNDCCHSDLGMKQNMGVLEAAVKFCKVAGFVPVLVTNTDWTDVLFCKKGSSILNAIELVIKDESMSYVELPDQLLGALNVQYGKSTNLSFV